jgi:hypothetical protein
MATIFATTHVSGIQIHRNASALLLVVILFLQVNVCSCTPKCPYYDAKFVCSNTNMQVSNKPSTTMAKFPKLHNIRDMYFVGDSLSCEHFSEFACYFNTYYNMSFGPTFQVSRVLPTNLSSNTKCREASDSTTNSMIHTINTTRDRPIRLCFIEAGTLHGNVHSASQTAQKLNSYVSDSIIILNEGVWWRNTKFSPDVELSRLKELKGVKANMNTHNNLFIWRETLAQHFPTVDGRYGSWYSQAGLGAKHGDKKCSPTGKLWKSKYPLLKTIEGAKVPIITIWEESARAATQHIELRTPNTQTRGMDCTHFCAGSPLMQTLVHKSVLTINHFSNANSRPTSVPKAKAKAKVSKGAGHTVPVAVLGHSGNGRPTTVPMAKAKAAEATGHAVPVGHLGNGRLTTVPKVKARATETTGHAAQVGHSGNGRPTTVPKAKAKAKAKMRPPGMR